MASEMKEGYTKKTCPVCGKPMAMPVDALMCRKCAERASDYVTAFDQYEGLSSVTNRYPEPTMLHDLSLGLCSEAGEVAGLVKKIDRDKNGEWSKEDHDKLALEIGDVLWYCAQLSKFTHSSLEQIANLNLEKLFSRARRGKIGGSGDFR